MEFCNAFRLNKQLKNSDASIYHTLLQSVYCFNLNDINQVAYYQNQVIYRVTVVTRSTKWTRMTQLHVCFTLRGTARNLHSGDIYNYKT